MRREEVGKWEDGKVGSGVEREMGRCGHGGRWALLNCSGFEGGVRFQNLQNNSELNKQCVFLAFSTGGNYGLFFGGGFSVSLDSAANFNANVEVSRRDHVKPMLLIWHCV